MNQGALLDVLNNIIIPYLLCVYTNPTILTFKWVNKQYLQHLTNYVYFIHTIPNPDQLTISCALISLVLPQFDVRILEIMQHDNVSVERVDSIFPTRQFYKDKECIYLKYLEIYCILDHDSPPS